MIKHHLPSPVCSSVPLPGPLVALGVIVGFPVVVLLLLVVVAWWFAGKFAGLPGGLLLCCSAACCFNSALTQLSRSLHAARNAAFYNARCINPPPGFALFWPFWPAISEPGLTSRRKVPLVVLFRSASAGNVRFWPKPPPPRPQPEAKQSFRLPGLCLCVQFTIILFCVIGSSKKQNTPEPPFPRSAEHRSRTPQCAGTSRAGSSR